MAINTILKELRQSKNMTQAEAADFLGVNLSSYQKYERAKNTIIPSVDVIVQIADRYNVSTDYLLGRTSVKAMAVTAEDEMSEEEIKAIEDSIVDSYTQMSVETRRACIQALMQVVGDVFDIEEIPEDEEMLLDTDAAL